MGILLVSGILLLCTAVCICLFEEHVVFGSIDYWLRPHKSVVFQNGWRLKLSRQEYLKRG